jgi:putative transposase
VTTRASKTSYEGSDSRSDQRRKQIAAVDFFTVHTMSFRILYCFILLLHDRRKVVHFNVTLHPTAVWTAQQMIEAFPEDTAPRYLLRDRDQIYGEGFRLRVAGMQIEEVITAPRSPFQNPYVERMIGNIRRECLDHLIIINGEHLGGYCESISITITMDEERKFLL